MGKTVAVSFFGRVFFNERALQVVNKELFQTGRIETTLISPLGIQQRIEEATSHYDKARAFVRPSGTEPIVRVYAEAQTDSHAYKLAKELEALVLSYNS